MTGHLLGLIFGQIFHPQPYVFHGGLWVILLIVFVETALLIGFFLPGDALLVVVGIFSSTNDKGPGIVASALFETHNHWIDLLILWVLIIVAGIVGNIVGYWLGIKTGHLLEGRKDNFLFKKKYLLRAHDFYEENGGMAIIFARFIPFIRTFAPFVAGMVEMDKKKFMNYNIIGCMIWAASMLLTGHLLYRVILFTYNYDITNHLDIVVISIVALTLAIILFKIFFKKNNIQKHTT